MRNLFSVLAAFFVGILLCISVLACANDPVEVNNSSNDDLKTQINALTAKINELETRLAAAEGKVDNIEDEIDYEIVFQKFNQYFDGCDCNYDEEIAELKEAIEKIKINSPDSEMPKILQSANEDTRCSWEYDSNGRLVKLIISTREVVDSIYNISYDGHKCIINKEGYIETITFDKEIKEIDNFNLLYILYVYFSDCIDL